MSTYPTEAIALNMTGGWDHQVNGRADQAEEDRRKMRSWEEQQKAMMKRRKRTNRLLYGLSFGLILIIAGGCSLNYVNGIPQWVSIAISIVGVAALYFTLGWISGYKCRR